MPLFISPPFGNYLNLPGCIPIHGSYTPEPRPGWWMQALKTVRYSQNHGGYVNRMGLRNPGLQAGLNRHRPGTITSIAIRNHRDVNEALAIIPDNLDIELNLSCPNVDKECVNSQLLGQFVTPKRRWCIAKLAPTTAMDTVDQLYQANFRQFHFSNTLKLGGMLGGHAAPQACPLFQKGDIVGGLSGPSLIPYTERLVRQTRKRYPDAEIIAGGGVTQLADVKHYLEAGADHISVSTLFFNPFKFVAFYMQMRMHKII